MLKKLLKLNKFYYKDFVFTEKNDFLNIFINLFFLIKIFLNFIQRKLIQFNVFLKNIFYSHKNYFLNIKKSNDEVCYIVGGGPSLKNLKLNSLSGKSLFTTSFFHKHSFCNEKSPEYYCFLDPLMFNPYEFKKQKNYNQIEEMIINTAKDIKSKTSNSTYVFPYSKSNFKAIKELNLFPQEKVKFIKMSSFDISSYIPSNLSLKSGLPFSFNVLPWIICIAILKGYKKIYLIACEQDLYLNSYDSFKSKEIIFDRKKVENPDYNIKDFEIENLSKKLHPFCSNYISTFLTNHILGAHLNLELFAKQKGVKIIDTTKNGLLDMYEKIEVEKITD